MSSSLFRLISRFRALLLLLPAFLLPATLARAGTLQAGAAKVDITPAPDSQLPMSGYSGRKEGFKRIHDHIYARTIVLSDGNRLAAIVSWELIGVPTPVWEELSQRIQKEAGIAPEDLLLAAVHDHAAPTPAGMYGEDSSKAAAFTKQLEDSAVQAILTAKRNLRPARMGIGTEKAYVNINRREYSARQGGWWLGFNPDAPSDKTVTVIRFDALSGKPIALFINYPVHAVVMGPDNYQLSGDLAGATSRFVENYYSGKPEYEERNDAGAAMRLEPKDTSADVVAVWTSGAAGDQNPVSEARGEDFTMVDALGAILGEAAVRAVSSIQTTDQANVWGKQQVVTCPGRKLEPGPRPRKEYKWNDADPVNIRLSLLMINDIALTGVSGEPLTMIYQHLRNVSRTVSPSTHIVMVAHADGSSGYIPDDAAFGQISYENAVSHLQPGCAENAIVSGFLGLIQQH